MARTFPGSPSGVTSFSDGSTWEQGIQFEPTAPATITEIWWYRHNTTSGHKPSAFRIWNKADSTTLYTAGSIPDDGLVGWQAHVLSTPLDVVTGQDIIVSATYGAGIPFASVTQTSTPAPDTGMQYLSPERAYRIGAGIPNAFNDTTNVTPFNVTFTTTDVPNPDDPPTNFNIDNALARWFASGDDNIRQNELPYTTKTVVDGNRTRLDNLVDKIDASGWPVVLGGVNKANIPAWLSAAGTIISAISSTVDTIHGLVASPAVPDGGATSAQVLAVGAQVQTGTLRWLTSPGTLGWTLDDTVAFAGPFVVDAEADLIFVNITTVGSANRSRVIGGLEFLTFPWWWVPLRAGAIVGTHRTCMALSADLYEPGRRLPGALVVVPDDFEGEYEIWRYTG